MADETKQQQSLQQLKDIVQPYFEVFRLYMNDLCEGFEPWQIIIVTFGLTVVLVWLKEFLFQDESLLERAKKFFFRNVRRLPMVKARIAAEIEKTRNDVEDNFNKGGTITYMKHLPKQGLSQEKLFRLIEDYRQLADVNWEKGHCSGTVYSGDPVLTDIATKVYGIFAWSNPLHSDVFPDVRKMEAEVVRMCCNMFHGGPDSCGNMTSGGTESILMACKTFRDRAYEKGIKFPEMLVPVTAHAAFDKAAHAFRIKIKHIPVDSFTMQVDVDAMKKAISRNTCMLVGSAPGFPHGIMDPIEEISKLGVKYDIPVHVDSCLGGFLVPFMDKAGFPLAPFDFRLPGVTSISADTHKYGYAPKGSSVVLYSNKNIRLYQYFVAPDWPGGIYATATLAGSRAGAIVAACWATMVYIGEQGYINSTRQIIQTRQYIEDGLRQIEGLFVYGKPSVSVIGFGSLDFNIYRLSDMLTSKGWNLNALQFPSSVHLCVTLLHTKPGVADHFLQEVRQCTAAILKDPNAKCGGMGAIYGMAQSIPDRSLVSEMVHCFLDGTTSTGPSTSNMTNGSTH
ncbi:sphingosine-1-phosphate lyase 1 isoform X2 [Lingula anatina]|uniref:Sphingosine-1-phosphate lyase 1 n=1 Tax=Lingula anatina TaxID=7574 RepID=A0A1S3HFE2_LINAN|nr:sphingosine-1-phosphate lyase 1 isoform X2 [Lingula anatina]|eukprot:XP_013384760.2 sphingosine-1-phosphate lyase 1 isoform X2 [Lingula anatina]